jgi:hypothetical protein
VAGQRHLLDGNAVSEVADGVRQLIRVQKTGSVVVVEGEGPLFSVGGRKGGREGRA